VSEPFSLLLPVYAGDDPEHLARAFRSAVVDQELRPDEVVVVQDGPVGDRLAEVIGTLVDESPVPANLLQLERNLGLARALNRGLDACSHEIVARMDADDISLPTRFLRQVEHLLEHDLDLLGAGMYEFEDEGGSVLGRRVPPVGAQRIARYARFHDPFNHPTVVYRRSAVAAAGGYEPVGLMEDYWLFARMILGGAKVDNLPDPLVMYRVGAGAYARRGGLRQLKSEFAIQRRFRGAGFTTRAQAIRNVLVRGGYRLVPEVIRRPMYRRVIARGFHS
jgi:glycosyltransferase involved in cell wall biosynthesis